MNCNCASGRRWRRIRVLITVNRSASGPFSSLFFLRNKFRKPQDGRGDNTPPPPASCKRTFLPLRQSWTETRWPIRHIGHFHPLPGRRPETANWPVVSHPIFWPSPLPNGYEATVKPPSSEQFATFHLHCSATREELDLHTTSAILESRPTLADRAIRLPTNTRKCPMPSSTYSPGLHRYTATAMDPDPTENKRKYPM